MGAIIKKSFDLLGHYTSVSLETEFWEALQDIAQHQGTSVRQLILKIDDERLKFPLSSSASSPQNSTHYANLSSAVRVFVLQYYQHNNKKNIKINF